MANNYGNILTLLIKINKNNTTFASQTDNFFLKHEKPV